MDGVHLWAPWVFEAIRQNLHQPSQWCVPIFMYVFIFKMETKLSLEEAVDKSNKQALGKQLTQAKGPADHGQVQFRKPAPSTHPGCSLSVYLPSFISNQKRSCLSIEEFPKVSQKISLKEVRSRLWKCVYCQPARCPSSSSSRYRPLSWLLLSPARSHGIWGQADDTFSFKPWMWL